MTMISVATDANKINEGVVFLARRKQHRQGQARACADPMA